MTARSLASDEVETPRFPVTSAAEAGIFDLSSHARAREALDFGLAVSGIGFNVFVMGDDRTGRMTATMSHLADAMARRPPANDWVYLNNFWHPNRPGIDVARLAEVGQHSSLCSALAGCSSGAQRPEMVP